MIFRNMPALTHLLNRRKQVDAEGNLSGKSALAAPVRKPHKMPFNTAPLRVHLKEEVPELPIVRHLLMNLAYLIFMASSQIR